MSKRMKMHQIKSKWYYIFWSVMAISVVGGQIYVGLGYREMSKAIKLNTISITCIPEYIAPSDIKNPLRREFE